MKIALFIFLLLGLSTIGIGVYVVRKNQSTQTLTRAVEMMKPLDAIISDCNYLNFSSCNTRGASSLLIDVPLQVESTLRDHASPMLALYRESVDTATFTKLGQPMDLPQKDSYSVAEIIARTSLSSQVDYRLLLTLFAIQGKEAWNGNAGPSNAFNRKELSFADQLSSIAFELQQEYRAQRISPTTSVLNGGKEYPFVRENLNVGSRALYSYFAKTMSTAQFEETISLLPSQEDSLQNTWNKLFHRFPTDSLLSK